MTKSDEAGIFITKAYLQLYLSICDLEIPQFVCHNKKLTLTQWKYALNMF